MEVPADSAIEDFERFDVVHFEGLFGKAWCTLKGSGILMPVGRVNIASYSLKACCILEV